MTGTDVTGTDVTGTDVIGTDVTGTDVTGTAVTEIGVTGTDVTETDVTGTDVTETAVTGTDVTGTDVTGTDVTGTDVTGTAVTGTDVTGTDVTGTDVTGTDVTGTDVTETAVTGTDVTGTDVTGTDVIGIDVTGTDVIGIDVTETDVAGTDVNVVGIGAELEVEDLSKTIPGKNSETGHELIVSNGNSFLTGLLKYFILSFNSTLTFAPLMIFSLPLINFTNRPTCHKCFFLFSFSINTTSPILEMLVAFLLLPMLYFLNSVMYSFAHLFLASLKTFVKAEIHDPVNWTIFLDSRKNGSCKHKNWMNFLCFSLTDPVFQKMDVFIFFSKTGRVFLLFLLL